VCHGNRAGQVKRGRDGIGAVSRQWVAGTPIDGRCPEGCDTADLQEVKALFDALAGYRC